MKKYLLLLLSLFALNLYAVEISFINSRHNGENKVVEMAVKDASALLSKAFSSNVETENNSADILLVLPSEIEDKSNVQPVKAGSKRLYYPNSEFEWSSRKKGAQIIHELNATTYQGVANGIYALLQEALGFQFYHPREMIVPKHSAWPLQADFSLIAKPRFNVRGFHLHTMHPLELTEALLDPDFPNAIEQVKEYIDWLARNGQNYFEFNLLKTISKRKWPAHAKQIVDYCHDRGIIAGVDISLHMIQQKAFMLYRNPPFSFRSKKKQIKRNLEWLFQADWDVVNMEFSTTEFTQGNLREKEELRAFITELIIEKYDAKLIGRKHVVKESEMVDSKKSALKSGYRSPLDSLRGMLIHTVMFYSLTDEVAPVYGNENLQHMYAALLKEMKERETWYYPETAYWITFDNSVPMFLMPYLNARLDDILLVDSLGIPGHITFSSGWEWGYWLFDWSIARWSWKYRQEEKSWEKATPTQFLDAIFPQKNIQSYFQNHLNLQQNYLKDNELVRYMTAMTVTDEMPGPVNLELHPRPEWPYKYIRNNAPKTVLDSIEHTYIPMLSGFYDRTKALNDLMQKNMNSNSFNKGQQLIFDELYEGLKITGLRAWHRKHTLQYLIEYRRNKIEKRSFTRGNNILNEAKKIRMDALKIVRIREQQYRYNLELLNSKRRGHTAYHFGYLYPVRDLHFWHREEMQAKTGKYGAFYRIIWNVPRIIGLW
ncbi:MAG: hypothetical protein WD334_00785 [Chitinophagales bacterium]